VLHDIIPLFNRQGFYEFVYNYRNILRFLFSKWSAVTTSDKNKTN
jgi:hypothetical protein